MISNGNRTEWSPIRSVIIRVITKSDDRSAGVRCVYHEYASTDRIGRHEVLSPCQLITKITIFKKTRIAKIWKTGKMFIKIWQRRRKLLYVSLKLRLVDLNYSFECDWLIEQSNNKLSDNKLSKNKLSDNNLASELVENRSFLNQSQSRKL